MYNLFSLFQNLLPEEKCIALKDITNPLRPFPSKIPFNINHFALYYLYGYVNFYFFHFFGKKPVHSLYTDFHKKKKNKFNLYTLVFKNKKKLNLTTQPAT